VSPATLGVFRPPAHRATTATLPGLFPFVAAGSLGVQGVFIGHEAFTGTPFHFDPIRMYLQGLIGDPNMLIVGRLGYRKSTLVKLLACRLNAVGYSSVYLDPKGETTTLAEAFGVRPLRMVPGGDLRLNPLDPRFSTAVRLDPQRERALLLRMVLPVMMGRALRPAERKALADAVSRAGSTAPVPTLIDVHTALLEGRRSDLADALGEYITGPGAGLFDGPTSDGVDMGAPLIALNLRRLVESLTVHEDRLVTLALASSWLFSLLARRHGYKLFVADEAWFLLRDQATAEWFESQWKLCRATSTANVAVLHRLSDLRNAIPAVQALVADCSTQVIFAQEEGQLPLLRQHFGLTSTEAEYVRALPKGVALWRVGGRSFVVRTHVSEAEMRITDTDAAMRGEGCEGS
jgi:type IV secretory pathway VirB4 component